LGQVVGILLNNAFNYTPSGGGVSVHTSQRHTDNRTWSGISVSDTGPGIPPDEQPLIFKRFFRGRVGRESQASGTGLGLSIAREIIQRHNGLLEVYSEGIPGKGTTFTVWIPAGNEFVSVQNESRIIL
jgi:signal transduction histidine kinase